MSRMSVKQVANIAKDYGYKLDVVKVCNDMAYLEASSPFFSSPYPDNIRSNAASYRYIRSIFNTMI
jgi:hypothetical protein